MCIATKSILEIYFSCTPQYMVLGYIPELLECNTAKYLFKILSVAAKSKMHISGQRKLPNYKIWTDKIQEMEGFTTCL